MDLTVQLNEIIESAVLAIIAIQDESEGDFKRRVRRLNDLVADLNRITQDM